MAKIARTIRLPIELQACLDKLVYAQAWLCAIQEVSVTDDVEPLHVRMDECYCDDLKEFICDAKVKLKGYLRDANAYVRDSAAYLRAVNACLKEELREVKAASRKGYLRDATACLKAAEGLHVKLEEYLCAANACVKEYFHDAKGASRKGYLRDARVCLKEYLRAADAYMEEYHRMTKEVNVAASVRSLQASLKEALRSKAGRVSVPTTKVDNFINTVEKKKRPRLVTAFFKRMNALAAGGALNIEDMAARGIISSTQPDNSGKDSLTDDSVN